MAVSLDMHNAGDAGLQCELAAMIERVFAERPGDGEYRLWVSGPTTAES